ncbi:hypothetical protein Sjap_016545 [Stephania japonica]|uniref:Uncharacterized protein n=1 Tax=Stephania japonica TaxID=461633 RepID=A0AAP0IL89_9MAGN
MCPQQTRTMMEISTALFFALPPFNNLDQKENEEVSLVDKSNNHGVKVKFNDPMVQIE